MELYNFWMVIKFHKDIWCLLVCLLDFTDKNDSQTAKTPKHKQSQQNETQKLQINEHDNNNHQPPECFSQWDFAVWGRSKALPRGNECFCRLLIRISKVSGWWEWNWKDPSAVQLKLVDPFIIPHFHGGTLHLPLDLSCESCFFARLTTATGTTIHHNTGSECLLLEYMECQKESTNPNIKKSSHTKTPPGRIQRASAELCFSTRRVRRGLIFWATLPPAQLERNAPFHKLNWGHAWHGNNRGRSHNFPDSGDEGGGEWGGA